MCFTEPGPHTLGGSAQDVAPRLRDLITRFNEAMDNDVKAALAEQVAEEFVLRARVVIALFSQQGGAPLQYSDSEGKTWWPVFTSQPSVDRFDLPSEQRAQTRVVTFDEVNRLIAQDRHIDGVSVDVRSESFVFTRYNIANFAAMQEQMRAHQEQAQVRIPAGARIAVGDPAHIPEGLLDALSTSASADMSINRMWMRQILEGGVSRLLLVVDHGGTDWNGFANLTSSVTHYLPQGESMDAVSHTKRGPFTLPLWKRPFYKKGHR